MEAQRMDARQIAEIFDGRAERYVTDEWHRRYAEQLVDVTPLREGDRVLDAGTGTGFAARAIARRVGPTGHVVGVDLSPRMLDQARTIVDDARLKNVEFVVGDASDLRDFATASFDVVVCSAGLLYMPVINVLTEWRRLLKPDGAIAFSTMRTGSPLPGRVFRDCAKRFGVDLNDPCEPLGSEERCRHALEETGFDRLQLIAGRVDFATFDPILAWESNFRSAAHKGARELSAEQQDALRVQYLDALQQAVHADPEGAVRADAIFAIGRRPADSGITRA